MGPRWSSGWWSGAESAVATTDGCTTFPGVVETPGEPAGSTLADRTHHGAYPTLQYRGLVFAYLGPPAERPEFPIFDTFEMPGYRLRPNGSRHVSSCNWLQLKENSMDPAHAVFLHDLEEARERLNEHRPSIHPEKSLEDYFAGQTPYEADVASLRDHYRERVVEWRESPVGMVSIHTQRASPLTLPSPPQGERM